MKKVFQGIGIFEFPDDAKLFFVETTIEGNDFIMGTQYATDDKDTIEYIETLIGKKMDLEEFRKAIDEIKRPNLASYRPQESMQAHIPSLVEAIIGDPSSVLTNIWAGGRMESDSPIITMYRFLTASQYSDALKVQEERYQKFIDAVTGLL